MEPYLHLRYEGTDCALMSTTVPGSSQLPGVMKHGDFEQDFTSRLHYILLCTFTLCMLFWVF